MRQFKLTAANGVSVRMGDTGPYVVTHADGFSLPPIDTDTRQAPGQHGETEYESVFKPRPITLQGVIDTLSETRRLELRRELVKVCNPMLAPPELTYYCGDGSTYLLRKARVNAMRFPEIGDGILQQFLIDIIARDPFMYAPTYKTALLAGWEGGLTFPLTFPFQFETRSATAEATLQNDGDYETPIEAWFRGPLAAAALTNETTGNQIIVSTAIEDDEELYVCTMFGELKVTLRNVDTGVTVAAWDAVDTSAESRKLSRFRLATGANVLSYDPAGSSGSTNVTVRWRDRYVGR